MILVTGGEGYLGGRIVNYLTSNGLQVKVGGRVERAGVVKIDFDSQESLSETCKKVDCVIHLAAMNAPDCEKNPEDALLVNSLGTLRLINTAVKEGVSKFIYFSTSHVYGDSLIGIVNEETLARPINHYSITHKTAEDYLISENAKGTISGTVLRLTNAVGYPQNKEANCWMLFVNDICKQAITLKKIKINSNPSIKKDFIPISCVCSLTLFVVRNNLEGGIFNASSGKMLSLSEVANLVQERTSLAFNFTPEIIFGSGSHNHQNNLTVVSNKKLEAFGFKIESELTNEIDELLFSCCKWFGG